MRRLEIIREPGPAALADVTSLLHAAERADGHRPLSDHLWLDLVQGGREGFAGLLAWEPGHNHPVGYAQVSRGNESFALELVIDPHHRYEMSSIGPELLEAALGVVRSEGGGHVHWWVFEPTAAHDDVAIGAGLRAGRQLHQMRVALPLASAAGDPGSDAHSSGSGARGTPIAVRAFRPGVDDGAWLSVNNRAFAHHPEQGGWTHETIAARQHELWFDPAGFLLHERDGRLAAFCWTKVHDDHEPPLGEIYVIAVDPDFHGAGLGRAMTIAGLEHLGSPTDRRRACSTGMLYVDADNDAAVGLYRSLGFTIHRTDRAYVGDIRP